MKSDFLTDYRGSRYHVHYDLRWIELHSIGKQSESTEKKLKELGELLREADKMIEEWKENEHT